MVTILIHMDGLNGEYVAAEADEIDLGELFAPSGPIRFLLQSSQASSLWARATTP